MSLITTTRARCRDCYKCLRSCPLKAIRICKGAVEIVPERCIFCGRCVGLCPQDAIHSSGDLGRVKELIRSGERLIASVSPTAMLAFGKDAPFLHDVLIKLGFAGVEDMEDAVSSMIQGYKSVISKGSAIVLSSHCPAVCELVEKYFPERLDNIAPVADMASCHARIIESQKRDGCRVVSIGPCLAQRALKDDSIDAVLTFDELKDWFSAEDVKLPHACDASMHSAGSQSGLLCVSGGLMSALGLKERAFGGNSVYISGIEECLDFLKKMPGKEVGLDFAELMACPGGCINGPFIQTDQDMTSRRFALTREMPKEGKSLAVSVDFSRRPKAMPFVPPETGHKDIEYVLRHQTSHLDCGICGYDNCLHKAKAVCEGMAEVEICVPMIRTQVKEVLSILEHTANGVILVDNNKLIRFANPAFYKMFRCEGENAIGRSASGFILSDCFSDVISNGKSTIFKRTIPEIDVSFRACIFPITGEEFYCGIFNDISDEERARQEFVKVKEKTLQRAQEVIGRQMKTAQEIAGLLGETTAETKVLLVKLMRLFEEESSSDALL